MTSAATGPGPAAADRPRPFHIRPLVQEEAAALGRLTVDAYIAFPGFEPGAYLDSVADVAGRAAVAVVLVAVDADGALLGGVTYVPGAGAYADFPDPADVGIRMLAVAPEARRRGVGTALVRECVARARAAGRRRIWLHTTDAMVGARRIYEREGFRRAPGADLYDGMPIIGFVLDLDQPEQR